LDNVETNLDVETALGEVTEAEHPTGTEMEEWVFTNDKTNPMVRQLFHLLYQSAFSNKLGVMHAKLKDKDEVHTLIVGVEYTPEGVVTWPIAKILTEDQQSEYLAPDGNGNYQ
jgi:hypothetical protein